MTSDVCSRHHACAFKAGKKREEMLCVSFSCPGEPKIESPHASAPDGTHVVTADDCDEDDKEDEGVHEIKAKTPRDGKSIAAME